MVYRRSNYPKRYARRSNYRSGARGRRAAPLPTYSQIGARVLKDVSMLKNLINVEFKTNDLQFSSTSVPSTGTINCLNGLMQGDDYNRRSGRQVRFKSLQWRCTLNKHNSAVASRIRVIFFIDKDPREIQCSTSDILETSVFSGIDSMRKLDGRKRFVILKDKTFLLNTDTPERSYTGYMKLDMKTVYDASTTGDISDIYSNSLHVLFLGDETVNQPTYTLGTRLRFVDN